VHRRFGVAGAVLAVAMIGMTIPAVRLIPAHFRSGHLSIDLPFDSTAIAGIVWGDIASLLLFATFVATAIGLRARPEAHRRLMLLASISIVGPATARVGTLLGWALAPTAVPAQTGIGVLVQSVVGLGLPLLLVAHDLRATRRLHPATLWGVPAFLAATLGAFILAGTAAGQAFVLALE
jgi:hypothetical protein